MLTFQPRECFSVWYQQEHQHESHVIFVFWQSSSRSLCGLLLLGSGTAVPPPSSILPSPHQSLPGEGRGGVHSRQFRHRGPWLFFTYEYERIYECVRRVIPLRFRDFFAIFTSVNLYTTVVPGTEQYNTRQVPGTLLQSSHRILPYL